MNPITKRFLPAAVLVLSLSTPLPGRGEEEAAAPMCYRQAQALKPELRTCEVAVYGGTPAGVTAAIEAARIGRKTLLLSFNRHVGGMTSGGLTATDLGKKESIGGLALDYYTRLGRNNDLIS